MNAQFKSRPDDSGNPDWPQSTPQLEAEVTQLAGKLNADNYAFLIRIAELDRRESWRAWGCRSCAYWLNWQCGLALNAARERLRTAHALTRLPMISGAFASGKLSYSKARAITRSATPENEKFFLQIARFGTASHLAKLVRQYERVTNEQSQAQQVKRGLNYFWDDDGTLVAQVVLPAEQGALFLKAMDSAVEALEQDDWQADTDSEDEDEFEKVENAPAGAFPASLPEDPKLISQRRADGLVMMAESQLAHLNSTSKTADRYQVIVYADVSGELPRFGLEKGPALPAESVKRLCCDASVSQILSANGEPVSIGRKSRTIPPPMRRALLIRDEGCRFPGCNSTRFVDGHHLRHWADGGETNLNNLILLCRFHHRLVHEGGFSVTRTAHQNFSHTNSSLFEFHRPDGELVPQAPECTAGMSIAQKEKKKHQHNIAWQWNGDDMDYGIALDNLIDLDQRKNSDS